MVLGSLSDVGPFHGLNDLIAVDVLGSKCRKERTVYSKEQKCLLQEHFHQCQNPDLEQRKGVGKPGPMTTLVCIRIPEFLDGSWESF